MIFHVTWIYELNKFLASENKAKLIAHFWDCNCESNDMNNLVNKLKKNQSNLSKHINTLLKANILKFRQKGKARFWIFYMKMFKKMNICIFHKLYPKFKD